MWMRWAGAATLLLLLSTTAVCAQDGAQEAPLPPDSTPQPQKTLSTKLTAHYMLLLKRSDVRRGLHLTTKQKEALDQIHDDSAQGQITEDLIAEASPEMADAREQSRLASTGARLAELLKPDQVKRLCELDLQWRGLTALGDVDLQQQMKVDADFGTQITPILRDYKAKRQEIIDLARQADAKNATGEQTVADLERSDTLDNTHSPERKKLDALKKDTEKKIAELLKPEEFARFNKAKGETFVFRKDIPGGWQ